MPGLFLPGVGEAHQLQQPVDAPVLRQAQHPVLELQVLLCGHVRVEGGGLHHRAHPPPCPVEGLVPQPRPVQGVVPGGGLLQAANHPDEGGLARAVFAHQAVDGPLGHVHVYVFQGGKAPVALAQPMGLQHCFHV